MNGTRDHAMSGLRRVRRAASPHRWVLPLFLFTAIAVSAEFATADENAAGNGSDGTRGIAKADATINAPAVDLSISVASRAFATLIIEPRLVWHDGLFGADSMLGVRVAAPVLLAATDRLDTGSVTVSWSQDLEPARSVPSSTSHRVHATVRGELACGIDVNAQVLGRFTGVTVETGIGVGIRTQTMRIAGIARWAGAVATYWKPSAQVIETFTDAVLPAPRPGWLGPDIGRWYFGVEAEAEISRYLVGFIELGGLYTPNRFVSGFDGMMFGQWPFSCRIGARIPVRSNAP